MSETTHIMLEAPYYAQADVIVVGAGPAGVAAAISAARSGASVILVERSGQPGGMATLGTVSIFMTIGNLTGIYREIIAAIRPDFLLQNAQPENLKIQFNPLLLRYHLNRMIERENIQLLYHTDFITPLMVGCAVTGVVVKTREGLKTLKGRVVIDCTGNAEVAIAAGAPYKTGRDEDGLTQPMTLMFQMQNTGSPVQAELPDGCYHYETVADLPQGRRLLWELKPDGTLIVNMTRVKGNGALIADSSHAEVEGLKQVFSVAYYLQRNGFENYILSHIAAETGVRESHRICGRYTLTEDDLLNARRFEDVIAQTNYEIDIHSPLGEKACHERKIDSYDIPYRCLVPQNIKGLLVAGRSLSASHVALSSARVMPTCFALGQAAGIAASLAVDAECAVADISIEGLHQQMKKQGVVFAAKKTPE
ncbi:FAD-dependent oxidoreductase [Pseudocitrobacter faecalis]|uniref:FAD-dependent oxidoreductase n=1 Tax=Pseudocitrobacter faecalis TaxID=1398493 RepID=UPI003B9DD60B